MSKIPGVENLDNLNKAELEELLRKLKVYRELSTKVWKRWKKIFEKEFEGKNDYSVEYYSDVDEWYVYEQANSIYKKAFNTDVKKEDIRFIRNDNIKWGLKVYLNDDLVDMSFLKFYNLLKK